MVNIGLFFDGSKRSGVHTVRRVKVVTRTDVTRRLLSVLPERFQGSRNPREDGRDEPGITYGNRSKEEKGKKNKNYLGLPPS